MNHLVPVLSLTLLFFSQHIYCISASELGALANAKKKIDRTLNNDLTNNTESKIKEIKQSLEIIKKYDANSYEELLDKTQDTIQTLPIQSEIKEQYLKSLQDTNIKKEFSQPAAQPSSRPLPTPPTEKTFQIFDEKITSFTSTLSKYNNLTSFNDITLNNEWDTLQALETEINASTITRTEKKQLEDKIKLIKGAIARWQIQLAARAINQAREQINSEIFKNIRTTQDINKLAERLETIFYNLVVRFAYGACISLVSNLEEAQKKQSSAEENLLYHKNIFSSDFKSLQTDVEKLNLALVFLFDESSDVMTESSDNQRDAAYQLGLKTIQLIETLEDIYAQHYVSNKKRLLGKKSIAKEKKILEEKKSAIQTSIPQAPPLPEKDEKKEIEKLSSDIKKTMQQTEPVVKEISRGDITAQELLDAKNRLESSQEKISTSVIPETEKSDLGSTLKKGLANIRQAMEENDEDDDDLEW